MQTPKVVRKFLSQPGKARYQRRFARGPKTKSALPYHKLPHPKFHSPAPSLCDPAFCRAALRWLPRAWGSSRKLFTLIDQKTPAFQLLRKQIILTSRSRR